MSVGSKSKVLVFPAGSEIGLEIRNSLKYSHHVELFGASGKSDHASYVYDEAHYVEDPGLYVQAPDFVARFNALLARLGIEFVYPTHDTVAWFLSEHQPEIAAKILTSPLETNRVARYKRATYGLFAPHMFCPKLFAPPFDMTYPVFLKPNDGQGGKGTQVAHDRADVDFYLRKAPDLLVMEHLPGDELSVDCFTGAGRELLFVGPRTRERVQMGISFRSTAVPVTDEIAHVARTINEAVVLEGAWFFQLKRAAHGEYKLLEFAPRQSSTMGLYRFAGVNFALLTLFHARGLRVEVRPNDFSLQLDRSLHNRFRSSLAYDHVYIDLDETLIAGRHVHEYAMAFVYQCRNRGVRVSLITKHAHDTAETLAACGVSSALFAEIIHLSDDQRKWDFMDPRGAIFIDNYWHDRKEVKERLGIPVFDVDGIECLLT